MTGYGRRALILVGLAGLIGGLVAGLLLGWWVWPVEWAAAGLGDLKPEYKNEYIAMISSAYARDGNLDRAVFRLQRIQAGNQAQLVSALAEEYIAEKRDISEISALAELAKSLGVRSPQVLAYLATSTPSPTSTPSDTPTPLPTATPTFTFTPTDTPSPLPSATFTPTSTPTPVPPTFTPVPTRPPATVAPAAPAAPAATATPVPPTAAPKPAVDFIVVEQRMWSNVENGGTSANGEAQNCGLGRNLNVLILDAAGNPLDGVIVHGDYSRYDFPPSGTKGPGKTENPLGEGDLIKVVRDVSGRTYTSQPTRGLSTMDDGIPISDLIAGGYCRDEANCRERVAQNRLCKHHYSYSVVFKRTW